MDQNYLLVCVSHWRVLSTRADQDLVLFASILSNTEPGTKCLMSFEWLTIATAAASCQFHPDSPPSIQALQCPKSNTQCSNLEHYWGTKIKIKPSEFYIQKSALIVWLNTWSRLQYLVLDINYNWTGMEKFYGENKNSHDPRTNFQDKHKYSVQSTDY